MTEDTYAQNCIEELPETQRRHMAILSLSGYRIYCTAPRPLPLLTRWWLVRYNDSPVSSVGGEKLFDVVRRCWQRAIAEGKVNERGSE